MDQHLERAALCAAHPSFFVKYRLARYCTETIMCCMTKGEKENSA